MVEIFCNKLVEILYSRASLSLSLLEPNFSQPTFIFFGILMFEWWQDYKNVLVFVKLTLLLPNISSVKFHFVLDLDDWMGAVGGVGMHNGVTSSSFCGIMRKLAPNFCVMA